jgi:copper transport protein
VGMTRRTLLAVLALAVAATAVMAPWASGGGDVHAHASLLRSSPANNEMVRTPPPRVVLFFSEPIEQRLSDIRVFDTDEQRADEGGIQFEPDDPAMAWVAVQRLEPGIYFVHWNNVSRVDGHALEGVFPFIMTNPDGTLPEGVSLDDLGEATTVGEDALPGVLDSIFKWLALFSLAVAGGAAFFLFAGLRPAAAFLPEEEYQDATDASERWVVKLAHVLLPIAFISAATLVLLAVGRFATDTSMWSYLTTVRVGQYRFAQLVLLVVALAGAGVLYLGATRLQRNVGLGVLIAGMLGAMFMYSMVSHSAGGTGQFWTISADFIHLVASAGWLGSLALLPVFLFWVRGRFEEPQRYLLMANVFDRFSIIAALSVTAIVLTGIFSGLAAIPTSSALYDTTYGRVLLVKLVLVVPLLAVAGVNAFFLKSRLVTAIDTVYQEGGSQNAAERQGGRNRLARLQRILPATIGVEIALIVAVFASVGVLSQTSTAIGEVAQREARTGFREVFESADLRLEVQITPNRVGLNRYVVLVMEPDGRPAETATQVRLRLNHRGEDGVVVPPSEFFLSRLADGDFRSQVANFTQSGDWTIEATVRRSDADDVTQTFVVDVARPLASVDAGGSFALPFTVFVWNEVAGGALAVIGFLVVLYRKQLTWLAPAARRAGTTAASLMMIVGAVLVFGVGHTHSVGDPRAGNPIPPTEPSIERGRMIFEQNCIVCHGPEGRGDGPQAATLRPPPADIRLHLPLHDDTELFWFIENGVPGTAMPAWGGELSDEDIWNVINFMRATFTEDPIGDPIDEGAMPQVP